jgi:soluble lytic murein transglycosylase-like protein
MIIFTRVLPYLPIVKATAPKYGVDPALILAHIQQESGFNPTAYRAEPKINDASYGIGQILLATARGMDSSATVDKLYDPAYNIDLMTRYIAKNMDRYPNSITSAIASYNAGSAFVNEQGNYTNSRGNLNVEDYVQKVTKNYAMFSDWLNQDAPSVALSTAEPSDAILPLIILASLGIVIFAWQKMK